MLNKVEIINKAMELSAWTLDSKTDLWVSNGNRKAYTDAQKSRSDFVCNELSAAISKILEEVPPNKKVTFETMIVIVVCED